MSSSIPTRAINHSNRGTSRRAIRSLSVCVVDPQTGDYDTWLAQAEVEGVRLRFAASASEALRLSRSEPIDLWVVNADLPGLGGADLCVMLHAHANPGAIYVVADDYSPATEQAAWRAGATLFLCKPAHRDALSSWLERARGVPPAVTRSARASD